MVDLHPKNKAVGSKTITRSARVILEQDDAKLIKDGEEVSLSFSRRTLWLAIGSFSTVRTFPRLPPLPFDFLWPPPFSHSLDEYVLWFSDFYL